MGKDYQQARDYAAMSAFAEKTLNVNMCDVKTKANCLPNEVKFIELNENKTVEELQVEMKAKKDEYEAVKAEQKAFEKERKEKEKGWKQKEKAHGKAQGILKQLEKEAQKKK